MVLANDYCLPSPSTSLVRVLNNNSVPWLIISNISSLFIAAAILWVLLSSLFCLSLIQSNGEIAVLTAVRECGIILLLRIMHEGLHHNHLTIVIGMLIGDHLH